MEPYQFEKAIEVAEAVMSRKTNILLLNTRQSYAIFTTIRITKYIHRIEITRQYLDQTLSYLVKVAVSRSESINDGALYVDLVKGRLQLSTDHAVYSFDDKYDNFVKALKAVKADLFRNKSILVLGGGLGSIPYILEKNHQFQGELTMVENDPAVIRLFLEYSLPRMNTLIDIRESDAIIFMEQNSRKYDMIIVDLFIDDTVPDQFLEADFLMLCKDNLVKGAWSYSTG